MFKVKSYGTSIKSDVFPIFGLTTDSWNDFGTYCLFNLRYYKSKTVVKEIGTVKILQKGSSKTKLSPDFTDLDDNFISLGQDTKYYTNLLKAVGESEAIQVLIALNDISWESNKSDDFEHKPDYRNALLRTNSAYNALRFGRAIILDEEYDEDFSFDYSVDIPGADSPFEINVDFDEEDDVPGRIVGVIGRNAVGKTQLLGNLAKDLVQVGKKSKKSITDREKRFVGKRPIFNKVITVSYSAFDKFIRPQKPQASYVYCGIRNEKGNLSKKSLIENYKSNLIRINEGNRVTEWISFMVEILGEDSDSFQNKLREEAEGDLGADDTLSFLSSGQSILAHFVTALVARIQINTLVLFDEPETHLHPNAVANLFNVFNRLLRSYESFAIIATHSPIVIQEIPSKRVILLSREGNSTIASKMQLETFGENISELTRHVFDTVSISNHYKKILKKLSKHRSFEEVNELFDDNLGFNAKSYLLAQYGDK